MLTLVATGCTLPSHGDPTAKEQALPADAQLVDRLAIAYGALRDAEAARTLKDLAQHSGAAVDALVGPGGRHGAMYAHPGSVLPADGATVGDTPGLALAVYADAPPESALRPAIDGVVLRSVAEWRASPSALYDLIDGAVAAYPADPERTNALRGESEQALAWALLAPKTDDIVEARKRAIEGSRHAKAALDAVRRARAANPAR